MSDELSQRLWRVQVLPLATIRYKGLREVTFDRAYLEAIADAFNAGAYDRVPFQVSPDGMHTHSPEAWAGDVRAVEAVADGLDVVIAATARGDDYIRTVQGLAAAPRLVEDYHRSDGRVFRVALQHVLGTCSPMITGLRGWQRVESVAA